MHCPVASYWKVAGRILRQRQSDKPSEAEQKQLFASEIKIRLTRGVELVGGGSGCGRGAGSPGAFAVGKGFGDDVRVFWGVDEGAYALSLVVASLRLPKSCVSAASAAASTSSSPSPPSSPSSTSSPPPPPTPPPHTTPLPPPPPPPPSSSAYSVSSPLHLAMRLHAFFSRCSQV